MTIKRTKLSWLYSEEQLLIANYGKSTIKELMELLPNRNEEAINNKIKRLKKEGRLGTKDEDAVQRSYEQRCTNCTISIKTLGDD